MADAHNPSSPLRLGPTRWGGGVLEYNCMYVEGVIPENVDGVGWCDSFIYLNNAESGPDTAAGRVASVIPLRKPIAVSLMRRAAQYVIAVRSVIAAKNV